MTLKSEMLVEKYPNLYRIGNVIGNSIKDGWFGVLNELSEKLEDLIIDYITNHPGDAEPPVALQVKEKFGKLRFYMSKTSTDDMRNLLYHYEGMSGMICGICGKPGKQHSVNHWIKTLCSDCHHDLVWKDNEVS